jgi:hypothetical protein
MAEDQTAGTDPSAGQPAFEGLIPQTAARFPHIIEGLKALWGDRAECQAYLDSLLVDVRGNRQGFPMPILLELMELNELFQKQSAQDKEGDSWASHESVL